MSKDTEILVNLLKPLVDFQCLALDKKVVDKNLEINLDKIYKIAHYDVDSLDHIEDTDCLIKLSSASIVALYCLILKLSSQDLKTIACNEESIEHNLRLIKNLAFLLTESFEKLDS